MKNVSKEVTANYAALVKAFYANDRDIAKTLAALIPAIGWEATRYAVAVAVNVNEDDGRISDPSKSWARGITAEGVGEYMPGYDALHRAILEGVADATIKGEQHRAQFEIEKAQHKAAKRAETERKNAEADAAPIDIPESSFVDGGGLYDGWQGGNNHRWRDDKELKALLLADFKRAGIAATVRFNRAGYLTSITVTVKLSPDSVRPFFDWVEDWHITAGKWHYYTDDAGKLRDIYGEHYYSLPTAEQDALRDNIARTEYSLSVSRLSDCGIMRQPVVVLTDAANAKLQTVRSIVDSYNRDCSNSMVDYFDRDIYDTYRVKIA